MSITGKPLPADLAEVMAAWEELPSAIKDGILAMVRSVTACATVE